MSAIDTPDYQRGVVSAQVLLATVPAHLAAQQVGVPPNCETLIVQIARPQSAATLAIVGVTSGMEYPVAPVFGFGEGGLASTWFCDVSSVIDERVNVTFQGAPAFDWYIYSDAAAHVTANVGGAAAQSGTAYVTSVIPTLGPGENLPQEVSWIAAALSANGVILPALGISKRYRILGLQMTAEAVGLFGVVEDGSSGIALCACIGVGGVNAPLPAQGVALANNAALSYTLAAGAGTMGIIVYYTIEAI